MLCTYTFYAVAYLPFIKLGAVSHMELHRNLHSEIRLVLQSLHCNPIYPNLAGVAVHGFSLGMQLQHVMYYP